MNLPRCLSLTAGLFLFAPLASGGQFRLDNGLLTAEFDDHGLTGLAAAGAPAVLEFANDSAALEVAGERLEVAGLKLTGMKEEKESLTYSYAAGNRQLEVVYQLKPSWRFVSKQLRLTLPAGSTARIGSVNAFRANLKTPVGREIAANRTTGTFFLRLGETANTAFLTVQNPFPKWERKGELVALGYTPDLEWRAAYGPFESDRVCIGLCQRVGTEYPLRNLPEWQYAQEPAQALDRLPTLDLAEFEAIRQCVAAFAIFKPEKSLRVHVPWCENDYQIDVATAAGRTEWKRILDQCAAVGVTDTLFTPANSEVAPLKDNADAWGWENCLWLGLGQKIRTGEWNIAKDPIPPSIQEMLDYAKAKNVKLIAYAYPTLGWKQNPEWTAWCGGKTGGYVGVDTGVRSFQDWFVDQLVAFQKRTGISGYSFDHWWIAYEPTKEGAHPTSKYAQWYGCRRILEELQRRSPGIIIDGRQQYQWFGPWTWLGGSYPHPTTSDEQPGSFENYPDLHFSRVSGNRQRWATWYFHMEQFTPWELVPGYMTHQTPRNDAKGQCVRDRPFHTRDWDLLGWRYSVVSSVGTAPFNHVVDLLPARDETEVQHFSKDDQQWLKGWMDWTDANRALLKKLRPIIGPPVLGRIDGTAAIDGDHGFVFLFNPNYREHNAEFTLDASLGVTGGDAFLLRELYPQAGRLIGKAGKGLWQRGDKVSLPLKGPEALVLELVPASAVKRPALLGATGTVELVGDQLKLTNVSGPVGREVELGVLLPEGKTVAKSTVNGSERPSFHTADGVATASVTFAGTRCDHCPQVGLIEPAFAEPVFRAELKIPQAVFRQLEARRKSWPVPYTEEELLATWRGSDRLLLFIQIADPKDDWNVGLKIDDKPIEVKKAYSDVFPLGRERTFTGFYVDVSKLTPEASHPLEVTLPQGLQPGQFQGLFLENVEAEFTTELAR
ncbi:MAG: hypothetical protein K9N23_01770 [Akkermansiaceae bacterium]|nr:hypothetical protein [Akkermansiaceae bacterium]MCF7730378.1 hypothetical protein [Akkermansiaceae bacterium]